MDSNTSQTPPVNLPVDPGQPPQTDKPTSSSAGPKTQSKYIFSVWQSIQTFFGIAIILATIFTLWTPANLFSNQWLDRMFQTWQTGSPATTEIVANTQQRPTTKIGIVAGHSGSDSGAVCDPPLDKRLTEVEMNTMIAKKVVAILQKEGLDVELLEEFDKRLTQYKAYALVSIHSDSCQYINNQATGYKVAAAKYSSYRDRADRLSVCLWSRYGRDNPKLKPHFGSVTNDMTDYHAFGEIHTDTTAAIIEIGFLNLDYDYLFNNSDLVAQGIANGILCYTRNEDVTPIETPAP